MGVKLLDILCYLLLKSYNLEFLNLIAKNYLLVAKGFINFGQE